MRLQLTRNSKFTAVILIGFILAFFSACTLRETSIGPTAQTQPPNMASINTPVSTPPTRVVPTPAPPTPPEIILSESVLTPSTSPPAGLLYRNNKGYWLVDSDGQSELIFDLPVATISPDGTMALYWEPDGDDIWLADLKTGKRRNLTDTPERIESNFRWWPNRSDVILFSSRPKKEGADTTNGFLTTVNIDGTGYRVLDNQTTVGGIHGWFTANPNGRSIAYGSDFTGMLYQLDSGPEPFKTAYYQISGSNLEYRIGSPVWSPDGKRLAWLIGKKGQIGLGVFDLETKTAWADHFYEQGDMGGWPPEPVWSPDGRWIAFSAWASTKEEGGPWVVDANGSGQVLFRLPELISGIAWSPDGRFLAISRSEAEALIVQTEDWAAVNMDLPGGNIINWISTDTILQDDQKLEPVEIIADIQPGIFSAVNISFLNP